MGQNLRHGRAVTAGEDVLPRYGAARIAHVLHTVIVGSVQWKPRAAYSHGAFRAMEAPIGAKRTRFFP